LKDADLKITPAIGEGKSTAIVRQPDNGARLADGRRDDTNEPA
jgi:hypothetical protein